MNIVGCVPLVLISIFLWNLPTSGANVILCSGHTPRNWRGLPMSTPSKKLKTEPASQERGATANSLEQTTLVPTRVPKRGRSGGSKTKTPTRRSGDKSSATSPDHPNGADDCARIMEMLGTTDPDFAKGIYAQLISASSRGDGRYELLGFFSRLLRSRGKSRKISSRRCSSSRLRLRMC
jgi:hypothetical protein